MDISLIIIDSSLIQAAFICHMLTTIRKYIYLLLCIEIFVTCWGLATTLHVHWLPAFIFLVPSYIHQTTTTANNINYAVVEDGEKQNLFPSLWTLWNWCIFLSFVWDLGSKKVLSRPLGLVDFLLGKYLQLFNLTWLIGKGSGMSSAK